MSPTALIALSTVILAAPHSATWLWLLRLGGLGLILLAFVDNSVIPLPGSMDLLTIVLAAHHPEWWWYYAIMATIGGVLGAYPTYRLGRRGGKAALERKLSKEKVERVCAAFEKHGAWAIAIPALIPPPFPLSPFLLAAGGLRLPLRKFFTALAIGRGVRYFLIAWLGAHYRRQLVHFFRAYYQPILWVAIALAVLSALLALGFWLRHRHQQRGIRAPSPQPRVA
ncbi:MAG: VTT domain-containing protein [Acidobacteriota bacterium]|nr:VTT domain-containing protein [Acidobacteriota bacterium]